MNLKKGISPVIATVIIIAVTLVIAIGVIGWIMGIWGAMGSTESLTIYPNATLTSSELKITVKNSGTATAKIVDVKIVGLSCTLSLTDGDTEIGPGETETLTYSTSTCSITSGTRYQIRVYTEAGNVYSTIVTAS